ncbi:MAG: U32 family peptidase [Bacteroidales bacterium]|nr:U32 family peptidase [Bacteroidales bacterium]
MELLSPARDIDTGIIAINSGADAVYIGASDFGARKAAANSVADIERLCRHAHLYGAKVYVTLNTILYNNELPTVQKLINDLHSAGCDALIIQDLGILKLNIPKIELHASTQMHNYDIRRIKFLDDIGFKRIVLARECSLQQIRDIRKEIKAEIECFGHGALCVSMSGQCYMSARLGGRSANRGECAQACRMKYSLVNSKGKVLINDAYLLSLKDFATVNKVGEMIDAGVDSFKIEGRLKDSIYVANVTAFYRRLIDQIAEGKAKHSSGTCFYDYEPDLKKVFNRGFTEYFLNGKPTGKIANFVSPKSMGEPIGKLVSIKGNNLIINTKKATLHNGDGLCCEVGGSLVGFRVEKTTGNNGSVIVNNTYPIKPGTQIFRNLDTEFIRAVEHSKTCRKISIKMIFSSTNDELYLQIIDEDSISTTETMPFAAQKANDPTKAIENLKNSLYKTGEQFQVTDFEYKIDNGADSKLSSVNREVVFVPNSVANSLRRAAIEKHIENRIAHFAPKDCQLPSGSTKYYEESGDYHLNVANQLARSFYKEHGCEVAQSAFELLPRTNKLEVMTTKYCIRRELGYCIKVNKKMPEEWLPGKFILKGQYQDFSILFDCKDCMMRVYAKDSAI